MKIFVTVGTTPFDRLIVAIDQIKKKQHEIIIQTANSKVEINNHQHFKWVDNINYYFNWADIVICHAGAGTVYTLLEMKKPIIVAPNFDRTDKHQKEISNYIKNNNYGFVCYDLRQLDKQIELIENKKFSLYKKESFFVKQNIIDFIRKKI